MSLVQSRPADILYFIGSLAMGGAERHLSQVLPALNDRGWSVEAVTIEAGGGFVAPLQEAGIPLRVLPSAVTIPIPKLRGASTLAQQMRALAGSLRERPPRILHCFLPTCCQIGALAALTTGFTPVVMSRRSQAVRPALFPGDKALERWALKRADLVFGHSSVVMDELRSEGIDPAKLLLNHNGLDIAAFDELAGDRPQTRLNEGWADDELIFVCVANLIPYKGHAELLQAFAMLPVGVARWRLVLVGQGDNRYTRHLKDLAQRLGVGGRVDFLGQRWDVPALVAAADAGILASHQEGFPNAILEYMAGSLPVIATAVGGILDAVELGRTGIIVPPSDPNAMAEAIASTLRDTSLRHRLGIGGRRRVEQEFSLSACVNRYELAYERLLEQK